MLAETAYNQTLVVRHLGQQDYLTCWQAMQAFTHERHEETLDELWLLEHPPVFTLGQSGKMQHVLRPGNIPVHQIDRGGQVTYHGPGQLVAYTLIDIKRKQLSIRQFVSRLEQSIIDLLAAEEIHAESQCKAPGVYVKDKKICSIGLRVRRGYAFHGLALNVAMDLEPFSRINPCGYAGLEMTQLSDYQGAVKPLETGKKLVSYLMQNLGYSEIL
jgi:lipoyl(octanoyl) transferase